MHPAVDSSPEALVLASWRSRLAALAAALLLFETVTGLAVYLLPFSQFAQFAVLLHTLVGLAMLPPVAWYLVQHWRQRRKGNLSHYQLLGYLALALLAVCAVSGLVITWEGVAGPRMTPVWETTHLLSGLGFAVFVAVHLATVVLRKTSNPETRRALRSAQGAYGRRAIAECVVLLAVCLGWSALYDEPFQGSSFPADYNWTFGEDRPFAPSLARVYRSNWKQALRQDVLAAVGSEHQAPFHAAMQEGEAQEHHAQSQGLFARLRACAAAENLSPAQHAKLEAALAAAAQEIKTTGAIEARALAGSARCGTAGCHEEIYQEWLPSAHRYSSMDDLFQKVQEFMAVETTPEHTRYCAGCHDPISLFSGAKNSGNITLSVLGADEGVSCLVCHSIVQTDVQGNADYTIEPPRRYVYEQHEGRLAEWLSKFLIRTYPEHHVASYSRPLYKTAEFCGACHKQYIDQEVNTDIGKVQGQNQYDSWKNSHWRHEDDPHKSIGCRECHLPLVESRDPARGDLTDYNRTPDDGKHRSHRTLAANQYVPALHNLPGHEEHIALTEQWLRGEYEIPEIAHKWTTGPVVRMEIQAPEEIFPGESFSIQVLLTNNKTGHDFPTGPLDMIESWIEIQVTDEAGQTLYHVGQADDSGQVHDASLWFKADGFDRKGELIDRHNLWDLVGAKYKRSMYPGVTDSVQAELFCPSMHRGRVAPSGRDAPGQRVERFDLPAPAAAAGQLTVRAVLWYRKANPAFLDRIYGVDAGVRSPITDISHAQVTIRIRDDAQTAAE